jgi:hypothetical protein
MVMEVNLHAMSLWDAIEDEHATCMEDKQALAVLLSSTLSDMHCMLVGKGCAKEAWEAIRVQYQRSERVCEYGDSELNLRPSHSRMAYRLMSLA